MVGQNPMSLYCDGQHYDLSFETVEDVHAYKIQWGLNQEYRITLGFCKLDDLDSKLKNEIDINKLQRGLKGVQKLKPCRLSHKEIEEGLESLKKKGAFSSPAGGANQMVPISIHHYIKKQEGDVFPDGFNCLELMNMLENLKVSN